MAQPIKLIHLGVGGRGTWPVSFVAEQSDPHFQSVGLVDISDEALAEAREVSGLGEEACFTSLTDALAAVEADAVAIITSPGIHAPQCMEAIAAGGRSSSSPSELAPRRCVRFLPLGGRGATDADDSVGRG